MLACNWHQPSAKLPEQQQTKFAVYPVSIPHYSLFQVSAKKTGEKSNTKSSSLTRGRAARTVASPQNVHVTRLVSRGQQVKCCYPREDDRTISFWCGLGDVFSYGRADDRGSRRRGTAQPDEPEYPRLRARRASYGIG